ncbi:MAG: hypothetical protein HY747_11060 [Elusimicrobia bacterium]|nr:hypothetical protein [Elusimicrobiota bacterium]
MTEDVFERIANLARLGPYPAEDKAKLSKDFGRILELFNVLAEMPPDGEAERRRGGEAERKTVFRDDVVKPFAEKNKIIENFPEKEGPLLKVPKVIE